MLTRQEKEKLVIDLYKQDKTFRDIAKEARMSFSDIGKIIKRAAEDDDKKELSEDVQAFELFAKGLKPLDVIIKLNLQTEAVKRLYKEYQSLCGMNELNEIYKKLNDDIEPFLQLYKIMNEQGLNTEEISTAVKCGNDLPILELKYARAKDKLEVMRSQKQES